MSIRTNIHLLLCLLGPIAYALTITNDVYVYITC